MSDLGNSEPWWQSRVDEIKSDGFNTENITKELENNSNQASTILEQYEKMVIRSEKIKEDIEKFPSNLEMEKENLLKEIKNAENINEVENKVVSIIATYSPWKLAAKNNKILWESGGKGVYLTDFIARLDSLDRSMSAYVSDLLYLFESPEKYKELLKRINEIENKQSERLATLDNMATLLSQRGFEIIDFNKMDLEERFNALEKLQILDVEHAELERRIKRTIGRFDVNAAADYNQQRKMLTKIGADVEFNALIKRIKNTENDYLSRLEEINKQFSLWAQEGFVLDVHIPILADELLEREAQIENISNSINSYKEIWKRLEEQLLIWPEEDAVTQIEFGIISEKDDIEHIVTQLENRSKLVEEEVRAKITRWKNKGFELKEIEIFNSQNPRFAEEEINNLAEIFEETIEAKTLLNTLDLSFGDGEEKRKIWNEKLKSSVPNKNTLNELMHWISRIEKRNIRHRKMLEEEWAKGNKNNDVEISNLNLLEFENLISNKERSLSSEFNDLNVVKTLAERLFIEIELWVENLKTEGWNVENLERIMKDDPNKIMKLKSEINKQINEYSNLINRLEKLPWDKNPSFAEKVINDLRKPELLSEIKNLIPQYMQVLGTSTNVEEKIDFQFSPWKPNKFSPKLINTKVIPQAELIIENKIEEEPSINEKTEEITSSTKKEEKEIISKNDDVEPSTKKDKIEIIKDIKKIKFTPSPEDWEIYLKSLNNLLKELGLNNEFDFNDFKTLESLSIIRKSLAKHVGIEPRDSRVDRLLRLSLRLIPLNLPEKLTLASLSKLIDKLCFCTNKLNKWTTKRLERRHSNGTGKLLNDTRELGIVLKRIPSPGFAIPLIGDNYELPSINDFEKLTEIVNSLERNIVFSRSKSSIKVLA